MWEKKRLFCLDSVLEAFPLSSEAPNDRFLHLNLVLFSSAGKQWYGATLNDSLVVAAAAVAVSIRFSSVRLD